MISKEKAVDLATEWHARFASLSKSDEVRNTRLVSSRDCSVIQSENWRHSWLVSSKLFDASIDISSGKLKYYGNKFRNDTLNAQYDKSRNKRSDLRRSGIFSINSTAQGKEYAQSVAGSLTFPRGTFLEGVKFFKEGQYPGKNRAGCLVSTWTQNTPSGHEYHVDYSKPDRKIYVIRPEAVLYTDIKDETVISIVQDWDVVFRTAPVRYSEKQILVKARQLMKELRHRFPRRSLEPSLNGVILNGETIAKMSSEERRLVRPLTINDESFGTPFAKLCYKAVGTTRAGFRLKKGVLQPTLAERYRFFPVELHLIWCVRFNPRRLALPEYDEICFYPDSGEVFEASLN